MANLGLIDFKIGLHIKGNVNVGQNKFEVHRNDFLHGGGGGGESQAKQKVSTMPLK